MNILLLNYILIISIIFNIWFIVAICSYKKEIKINEQMIEGLRKL